MRAGPVINGVSADVRQVAVHEANRILGPRTGSEVARCARTGFASNSLRRDGLKTPG